MTEASHKSPAIAKRRVLVIDDDLDLQWFLAMILEGQGYLVFCALGAAEGLDLYEIVEPDLVLLDATIPDASSLEVCRLIRSRRSAPAVVMLADETPNETDLALAEAHDVTDIVEKPFDVETMLGRLARAMGPRHDDLLH